MEGYIAQIIMFGGNFAPLAWAFCQGQILPISQNTALFSLLGTTYGGNGQSTFALPDLRSRVPIGMGQGPGLANIVLGQQAGTETVTLLTTNLPAHTHTFTPKVQVASVNQTLESPVGNVLTTSNNDQYSNVAAANGSLGGSNVILANTGSSQPLSIRQPYIGMNFIICLQGIYPARN